MIHKKVILVDSDFAMITLLVRLVRPQDCAWCPLGETLWHTFWIPLVDFRLIRFLTKGFDFRFQFFL